MAQVGESATSRLRCVEELDAGWRWYVAKTQPRKENLVRQHLERQSFETFLPFAPDKLRNKKYKAAQTRQPLFPGYIFVRLNVKAQRWRNVNSTIGVLYLVQFGDMPSPMPIGAAETLIEQTDDAGLFNFEAGLKAGDMVRVIGGPMHDFVGELVRQDGNGRSMVLLEFMNRKINTVIPEGRLIGVAKPPA